MKSYYNITSKCDNTLIDYIPLPLDAFNRIKSQKPLYIVLHEVSLMYENQKWDSWNLKLFETDKSNDLNKYTKQILNNGTGKNGERLKKIGWHYTVGDEKIVKHLEDTISTQHCGVKYFNNQSIGIERLVNDGTSFPDAIHNQAKLTATLMKKWNIPLNNVITHEDAIKISQKISLKRIELLENVCNEILENNSVTSTNIQQMKNYLNTIMEFERSSFDNESLEKILFILKENINNLNNNNALSAVNSIKSNLIILKQIVENMIIKKCPARAITGFLGGTNLIYKEIELCLNNNDFFEEILAEKSFEEKLEPITFEKLKGRNL